MRAHRLASLAAAFAASGAFAFDHYDLAALNDQALASLKEGDVMTACIMLHRAVRLAPYDVRTADNVRILETYLAGVTPPTPPTPPSAPSAPPAQPTPRAATESARATPPVVPSAPPAPWPAK